MKKQIFKKFIAMQITIFVIASTFAFSGCLGKDKAITHADEILRAIELNDMGELRRLLADEEKTEKALKQETSGNYVALNGGLWNWVPLSYAAKRGNVEAVKLLVEAGADVHQKTTYEMTPLFAAIDSRSLHKFEIANYLLDNGADIHMYANGYIYKNESILAYLLDKNGYSTTSKTLMQEGYEFFVRCVEMGAELEGVSDRGHLLLDACERENNLPMVVYMIETLGCDVNMEIDGVTPLYIARNVSTSYDKSELIEYLLAQGAIDYEKEGVMV